MRILALFLILMLVATGQGWPSPSQDLRCSWDHENDTPPVRLDDSEQWMCITEGTLQINGPNSYWCYAGSIDFESE